MVPSFLLSDGLTEMIVKSLQIYLNVGDSRSGERLVKDQTIPAFPDFDSQASRLFR